MERNTVLLVEDNEDNRLIYSTILQHFGYDVLEAGDGGEGVRLARERRPDVILMDVSLPVLDGWTATTMLKRDEDTARIPIIALTAHALREDEAKALEVGCDGFLAKPCEPRRVVEEVRRLTAGDRASRQSA